MGRSSNFSDQQRAEIYARDRATCGYTGDSLWIIDVGADPLYNVDWADHIHPVAGGGLSSLENGVCAGYGVNQEKADQIGAHELLFLAGEPTSLALDSEAIEPDDYAEQLERFAALHSSDWYLNRVFFRILLGVQNVGTNYKRTDRYYAKAAWTMLEKWRRIVRRSGVSSIEERGLVFEELDKDQELLLRVRDATSMEDVLGLIHQIHPIWHANVELRDLWHDVATTEQAADLLKRIDQFPKVSTSLLEAVREDLQDFQPAEPDIDVAAPDADTGDASLVSGGPLEPGLRPA